VKDPALLRFLIEPELELSGLGHGARYGAAARLQGGNGSSEGGREQFLGLEQGASGAGGPALTGTGAAAEG
jgi:hypothetical protein